MLASHKGALLKLGGEDVALTLKRLLQEVDDVDKLVLAAHEVQIKPKAIELPGNARYSEV